MRLHHVQNIYYPGAFLEVYDIGFLPLHDLGIQSEPVHDLLYLAGRSLRITDDLKMIGLARIAHGSGCLKGSAEKRTPAACLLEHQRTERTDIADVIRISAYHLHCLKNAHCIFMLSDHYGISGILPLNISPDRDINFNIKCFFYQCKDFSCNKEIFRMDFYAVLVKTVDRDRTAHPDKSGQFRDPAVSGG